MKSWFRATTSDCECILTNIFSLICFSLYFICKDSKTLPAIFLHRANLLWCSHSVHYYCQTCLQCRGLYAWAPWQPHWHGIPLKLPIVFLDSNLRSHAPGSSGSRKQIPSRMNETKTSVHTTEGIHTKYANRCTDTSSRHTNIMQAQPTLCLFPTWSVNGREWGVVVGSWGKTHVSVFHCCLVPVHKFHQWVPERSRERRERKSGIRITRRRSENQSVHASLQIFHINAPRWSCRQQILPDSYSLPVLAAPAFIR